jgi:hypothetical protein
MEPSEEEAAHMKIGGPALMLLVMVMPATHPKR